GFGAVRRAGAAVAGCASGVRLVESAALENDAHRVEDAGHWRAALGALRQRWLGDALLDVEVVTAAAAVSVDGHLSISLYPVCRLEKTLSSGVQLIQSLLFGRGSSTAGS